MASIVRLFVMPGKNLAAFVTKHGDKRELVIRSESGLKRQPLSVDLAEALIRADRGIYGIAFGERAGKTQLSERPLQLNRPSLKIGGPARGPAAVALSP